MTELQRYLAEEIAEDHADGILTRREAVRRLGLLGVSAAAASALLGSFASQARATATRHDHDPGDDHGHHHHHDHHTAWAPAATEAITFPGREATLAGAWAPAAQPRGGVLVLHENRGLNDHIRTVAGRLAATGYSALALDLLSREGGTDALADEAAVVAALNAAAVTPERFDVDMQDGVSELRRRLPRKRIGAIGFCFGGGLVWRLLASGERRLSAAAPFYGPFPEGGDLRGAKAAVLAVYGGLDTRVNATQAAAGEALMAAGLPHELATFTEADHAFFNDTNAARYNAPAAAEAYRRVIDWFDRFLGARRH